MPHGSTIRKSAALFCKSIGVRSDIFLETMFVKSIIACTLQLKGFWRAHGHHGDGVEFVLNILNFTFFSTRSY